jgi:hypothetical protein
MESGGDAGAGHTADSAAADPMQADEWAAADGVVGMRQSSTDDQS